MRVYEVKIGGIPHTMQLNPEDAERYGATEHKAPTGRRSKAKPVDSGDSSD